MPRPSPRPLAPAFARRALRGTAWVVVVGVACFAVLHGQLTRTATERFALAQARLVAASIEPGPGGALRPSITRLLDRYDRILAIATLDAAGGLRTVYPERPAHRAALSELRLALMPRRAPSTLPTGASFVSIVNPLTGEPTGAYGAIAPLNGIDFPDARRIAVLLRHDPKAVPWMTATTMFAVPIAAVGLVSVLSLTGWFRRRVANPLRRMASTASGPIRGQGRRRTDRPSAWRETSEIASLFDDLMHGLERSNAEQKRVTQAAERNLAERESEYKRRLRHANDRAITDRLTRLRNRAFLEEQLEPIYTRAREGRTDLSAVLLDLDNFKTHNDTHGHQAGDHMLRFVGALLKGAIRPEDFAIRYGGDEFILLLPACDAQQAGAIAERIVKMFGQYARRMGKATKVSFSAGVASIKSDGARTGWELVAQADAALYAAKRVGKNTVALGQPQPVGAGR